MTVAAPPAGDGLLRALHPRDPLWPLACLVLPLPVWWLLGLANLGWFLAAVPMAVSLVRRRRLRVPPGFGWWLAFLLWLVLSTAMLGQDPTGTVAEPASSRLLPVAFRFAEYGSATVMLLWALNLDPVRVPAARLARMLAVLCGWTVAGGLLGLVAPTFELTSVVETLLPAGIADNSYVQALVHPAAAQVQDVIGTGNARPSAPFAYTNTWGNALGLLLPFAAAAALLARRPAARWGWTALAVVALVPAVQSLNRGLWVALALGLALVVVLLFRSGHTFPAMAAVTVAAIGLVVVAVSPLGATFTERQSGEAPSDEIRSFSIARSVEVARESPVLGFGGTRAQAGSSDSIAVGKSERCPNCGNLALGTNGQLWFALVGQGFVGAFFYVMFHVSLLRRFLRRTEPGDGVLVACGAVGMALALWFCLVYDRTGPTGCIEFLVIAVAAKQLADRVVRTDPVRQRVSA
ncbi:hypothetical protein [Nocardioides sp. SYSU D00038]|uniref:hypothetical protein n=1 Tax=Nocardioides sp. SYSU D00038 TaxID=2812554 RepID=UPI0019680558|nr:hypothetical protein [Nocardioides sp. SYSU D00038]